MISGVTEVIGAYGKCIVVEDDLVVSDHFLKFMNGALLYYRDKSNIWGVTGYTYPFASLETYPHDVYMSYRICSWGWGTWKDRWDSVDWSVSDYHQLLFKPWRWIRFNRGGNDLFLMLRRQMQGRRDSWAIRFCYAQSRQNKLAVYPTKTLLVNFGFDGSGTHCEEDERFADPKITNDREEFRYEELPVDRKIAKEFKALFRITLKDAAQSICRKVTGLFQ